MRQIACCTALVFLVCCAPAAWAQGGREIEAFGGYSFTSIASGGASFPVGVAADASVSLSPRFSIEGDFGYHYRNISGVMLPCPGSSGLTCTYSSGFGSLIDFLGGVRFSVHRGKADIFVHGLVGGSAASVGVRNIGTIETTGFTVGGGAGIDVGLTQHLAFRAIQVDVLPSDFRDSWDWPVKLSAGLVFRFNK